MQDFFESNEYSNESNDLVDSITVSLRDDQRINEILEEEFYNYFRSDINADKTIDSVENKLKLYLSEISW